jgi:pentatricopeptide repeat protein
MERCYRVLGRQDRAVECLETLLRMNPTSKGLANRLLEDYLALDRSQDALRLLEEMQLKDSFTRLQLRQGLYLRLGNIDKAFEMIRKLAAYEDESHALSIQLDRELLELAPQRTDVCLHLADTLMDAHSKEERFEGARLLEEVVGREPRRADLRLRLIRYYMESDRAALTQPHLETLVREGTDDPTVYLNYAQLLQRQDRQEEAAGALETMTERLPEVWRGHVRLARIRLEQDRLEAAAKSLEAAEACADEEAAPLIEHLRNDIEQLRRKRKIDNMRENIKTNENEPDSRLQLIDELIRSDRIDEALKNSEALLHERPDCLPTLQEHLEAGIRRTSMNYRLCDYMADLYSKEARYDDLLRLYRLMSEKSMEPNNVMIQGCERVLSRAPGHVDARRELAFARRMNNDWPGVLDALAPLIQSDGGAPSPLAPEDQALWVEASYREGRLDEAARVGNAIAEELASESGFMLLMIDVLRGLKDHAGAYRIYEMATKAMPDDVRLRRLARRINYERKTDRLSQLSARPGETLTPDEHFEKAELHREFGEQEQAIVHYQKAADKDTLSKPALGNMAVVMCDRGMYDLAFETLEPIELTRELETANPELKAMFYQVALAMEKHKRFDKAVTFYKRIFRVDAAYSEVVDRLQRLS